MLEIYLPFHLIHPQAVEICRTLQQHECQAFIVGGCVRDLLLGVKPKDWDICSDATPQKIMEIFPQNIPTGLQHGTITVCMGEGINNHFEVTTFRIEGNYSDGRRPDEVFFVMDIGQDLARRDLTINAMAYDPINHRLSDPFAGSVDLKNALIKAVGNPNVRFQEDGLRIMRVARFAARFGYAIETPTFQAMRDNLETLKKVSKERIHDELNKILMSEHPSYGLQILQTCGALDIACPLLAQRQLPLLPFQDYCQGNLSTRLAYLYNRLPAELVRKELINLKYANKEIKRATFLLQLVEQFFVLEERQTANAFKSLMVLLKNHSHDPWQETYQQFITLTEAMGLAPMALLGQYSDQIVIPRKEMQINGDDLLNAGLVGPRIKKALDACYLEILRNPNNNTKYHLLQIARKY